MAKNEPEKEPLSPDKKFEMLLEQLGSVLQKTSMTPDVIEGIMVRAGLQSAAGMQKALRPENERPPLMSVFNPAGDNDHPKRPLKRKTYLNGHPEHSNETSLYAEQLTQAEIDGYNDLGDAVKAHNGLLDARNGLYKAHLRNRDSELHVEVPVANLDTRMNLPPTLILLQHELRTGESMMDLNDLLSEVTRLRSEVARLGGGTSRGTVRVSEPPTITAPGGPLVADLQKALESTPTETLAGGH
jgi:hypothetical protein